MSRWSRFAAVLAVGSLLIARRVRIGPVLRSLDQRARLFAPRDAPLYAGVAPPPPARRASCASTSARTADVPLGAVIVAAPSPSER